MHTRHERDRTSGDPDGSSALARVRVVAACSSVLVPVLLLVQGLVLQGSAPSAVGPLSVVSLVPLVLAVAAVRPPPAHRAITYAMVPLTGGLLSVSLTVGPAYFPGDAGWWVPAALVSALPLLALAAASSPREQLLPPDTTSR